MRTLAMPVPTWSRPPTSHWRRGSGRWSRPAWRSRCRRASSRWSTRGRGWPPGTVDAGYRGEIKVLLINLDPHEPIVLRRGDRIAQLVIQRVETARFTEVDVLPESVRGAGGYGSTGGFSQG
jgi:dUTPase